MKKEIYSKGSLEIHSARASNYRTGTYSLYLSAQSGAAVELTKEDAKDLIRRVEIWLRGGKVKV